MKLRAVLLAITIAWTLVNVGGLGIAVAEGELDHSLVHAVLALGFGAWAWYLRRKKPQAVAAAPDVLALQDEIDTLQRQLQEKQEGLDFAEQLLARHLKPESKVVRRELDDLPGE